jgi:hypothetical protein
MMCLACEEDAIWFAYLESRGLLTPDNPDAAAALFAAFPANPVPLQEDAAPSQSADAAQSAKKNAFSCDDPTA